MTTIIIDSEYDEIKSILIEESFALKPSLLADQNKLEDFLLSIDDDHELRDGRIVLRKRIEGGQSLSLSVDELSKNYFYCSLDALR